MNGYSLLPVDADGKPIHVGDRIEILHNGRNVLVSCMTLFEDGVWHVYGDYGGGFNPSTTECRVLQETHER